MNPDQNAPSLQEQSGLGPHHLLERLLKYFIRWQNENICCEVNIIPGWKIISGINGFDRLKRF